MTEKIGLYSDAENIVVALLGEKTCEDDPLTMVVAIQTLLDFKSTKSCGCTNRSICREHHVKAMRIIGNPLEGITIKAEQAND